MPLLAAATVATGTLATTANAFAATSTDSVRVAAGDDTYASSARPTYTFGKSSSLVAGSNGSDAMDTFLRFTVGSLPAGKQAAKVTLNLTRDTTSRFPSA